MDAEELNKWAKEQAEELKMIFPDLPVLHVAHWIYRSYVKGFKEGSNWRSPGLITITKEQAGE